MKITVAGKQVELKPMPCTRRNQVLFTEWQDRLRKFAEGGNMTATTQRIAKVVEEYPELLQMITPAGALNPAIIEDEVNAMRESYDAAKTADAPPFDAAEAEKHVREAVQKRLEKYIQNNPQIALQLYFDALRWPLTMEALNIGIECICATAERKNLEEDIIEALNDATSSAWDDTSAEEVRDYIDFFRSTS